VKGPTIRTAADVFAAIEAAAIKGERCPMGYPDGPLRVATTTFLAEGGWIKITYYGRNWRVVEIMEGRSKGLHTLLPPSGSGKPYKTIYGPHRPVMANRHMRELRPYKRAPVTLAKVNLPD
jgi:hypothetical protein